jgi:hypothetical protein
VLAKADLMAELATLFKSFAITGSNSDTFFGSSLLASVAPDGPEDATVELEH